MANRITQTEVKEIIDTDLEDISVFITAANQLVTAVCTDSSLSETELKEIERWLSAHFVAIRDMRVTSEKAGSVSQSYQTYVGAKLYNTMYGQQACVLDTSGALNRLNEKGRGGTATMTALV